MQLHAPSSRQNFTFLPRLEAVRGLAALTVAIYHTLPIIPAAGWEAQALASLQKLINGNAAVSIFFALSGVVLGGSLRRFQRLTLPSILVYCLRRFLRIYPALLVSLVGVVLMVYVLHEPSERPAIERFQVAYQLAYATPVSGELLLKNATLQDFSLNRSMWTLRTEMGCSLCLPFLFLLSRWLPPLGRRILLCALMLLGLLGPGGISRSLFLFYLGLQSYEWGPNFGAWLKRTPGNGSFVLLLILAIMLGSSNFKGMWLVGVEWSQNLCAGLLVFGLVYGPSFRIYSLLDVHHVRALGVISYSFYLAHLPVLFCTTDLFFRLCPDQGAHFPLIATSILVAVACIVTLPISWLLHAYVEVPGIRFSRWMSKPASMPLPRNQKDYGLLGQPDRDGRATDAEGHFRL